MKHKKDSHGEKVEEINFIDTFNDFTELTIEEQKLLEQIIFNRLNKKRNK